MTNVGCTMGQKFPCSCKTEAFYCSRVGMCTVAASWSCTLVASGSDKNIFILVWYLVWCSQCQGADEPVKYQETEFAQGGSFADICAQGSTVREQLKSLLMTFMGTRWSLLCREVLIWLFEGQGINGSGFGWKWLCTSDQLSYGHLLLVEDSSKLIPPACILVSIPNSESAAVLCVLQPVLTSSRQKAVWSAGKKPAVLSHSPNCWVKVYCRDVVRAQGKLFTAFFPPQFIDFYIYLHVFSI